MQLETKWKHKIVDIFSREHFSKFLHVLFLQFPRQFLFFLYSKLEYKSNDFSIFKINESLLEIQILKVALYPIVRYEIRIYQIATELYLNGLIECIQNNKGHKCRKKIFLKMLWQHCNRRPDSSSANPSTRESKFGR